MSLFGKAKFGGNQRSWFKLKDGDSVFRILPPMGDLQEEGRWSQFYKIHYGYKNSDNKMRTFESPEVKNRNTKMIEVRDAALDRINQLKVKLDEATAAGNEEMKQKLLKLVGGQKSQFNLDSNHYMNVVDLQGNVGILKMRHKCKLALDAVIKKLRESGVEPLDPDTGRYFVFSRSGAGRDTVYQVSVYKKKFKVESVGEVEQDVVHQITEDLAKRLLSENADGTFKYKEAARLDMLFKKPTAAEVERIVREGSRAVDEILDKASENPSVDTESDEGSEDDEAEATPAKAATPVQAAPVVIATGTANLSSAATFTPPAPAPLTVAAVSPTAAALPAAPKTTAQAVTEQNDADFLKSLGI